MCKTFSTSRNTPNKAVISEQSHGLPPFAVLDFRSAFAAHHLGQLATSFCVLPCTTQPRAFLTLIQILSLLPDPKTEPYFCKSIQSPQFGDLATLIATAFMQGVDWKLPRGPGYICTIIVHFFFRGCLPRNDGKVPIDASICARLANKLD